MTTAYRTASSTHPSYWCDDCERSHTGTHDDVRAILGDAGTLHGIAYKWDARRGGYNLVSPMSPTESQRVALAALSRVVNARYIGRTRVRMSWNASHNRRPRADVRERIVDVDAFESEYDAQRSQPAPMVRGGGAGVRADLPHVSLTDATRRTLARADRWTTEADRAERARDYNALLARINARDAA